jgi:predicted lipoprotein with Yx(FWY)xxD motif
MKLHVNRAILGIATVAALAIGVAACGSSSSNSSSDPATSNTSAGGATVATKSIAGTGKVLVGSDGMALYTNDMDSAGKIACDAGCTGFWTPLAAPSGGKPTSSDAAVQAKLGTATRPDGSSQVTFGGKPLCSFVQDSPGKVTGDGFTDGFGGTSFVWTVASTGGGSGSAGSGSATTTTQSSGGYGGSMY